jgi:hypothetical protein
VIPLGIHRFDFIGGEVTRHGRGWLDLVEYIRGREPRALVGVVTSGWFLGQHDFSIADGRCSDDRAYLSELRGRGVTHVIFSLDGPEGLHDRWRRSPGLYRRILQGFEAVKGAGLDPRVSLVTAPSLVPEALNAWLDGLAARIYGGVAARERLLSPSYGPSWLPRERPPAEDAGRESGSEEALTPGDRLPKRKRRGSSAASS